MERFGQSPASAARGSALILTVVLTSLLAIVGVLFLMAMRIDRMAASAQADNRELSFAVDTVLAQIREILVEDVPGVSAQEYHDYPDANDPWLADLEPYRPAPDPNCYWRQVSDITGGALIRSNGLRIQVLGERDPVDPNLKADPNLTTADADGDGVGDARWFQVPGITSSKGRPIYAAVRIVDNGGMLNVNTGYEFNRQDPNWSNVDGHSQLQVNIMALARRPGDLPMAIDKTRLREARANNTGASPATEASDLDVYEREAIWNYDWPGGICTPFDISDEMELRYRYLLNHSRITTRVENWGRFKPNDILSTPVDSGGNALRAWFLRTTGLRPDLTFDPNYAYRHIATTHSVDRLLMPQRVPIRPGMEPGQMVNVNTADQFSLLQAVTAALSGYNIADPAVVVANLMDYIDDDSQVTPVGGVGVTSEFYGFEQPCIYISELACRFVLDVATGQIRRSYAVELYKPYFEDGSPGPDPSVGDWKLVIDNPGTEPDVEQAIQWSGTRRFHVLLAEAAHPLASLKTDYLGFSDPEDTNVNPGASEQSLNAAGFREGARIELQRKVTVGLDERWLTVDRKVVPAGWMRESQPDGVARSLQRDIRVDKCIFRLWASSGEVSMPSLGNATGNYTSSDPRKLQAHPANRPLNNIGELGQIFAQSIYGLSDAALSAYTPEQLLIDVAHPAYANLFNYLTVINPAARNPTLPDSEMRVKGRININTAPPFVLAQLPWMQYRFNRITGEVEDSSERAVRIVEHRDANGAFRSIADLMQVPAMRELADPCDPRDDLFEDVPPGPDPTPDAVRNDLEERDLIFTRISDLVTVRSDAFTAYILVRIATDGPQKRVVAILDRSEVMSQGDPVRILGLQQVPDPR